MRRWTGLIILFVLISQSAMAQFSPRRSGGGSADGDGPYLKFEIGVLDPEFSDSGRLFGGGIGYKIDERLGWGVHIRYFKTNFTRSSVIADFDSSGIQFQDVQVELEFNTRVFSAILNLDYEVPLGRRSPFTFRAAAGMGWELIWNSEDNYVESVNRERFFNGFGWQLSTGMGLQISKNGILYCEAVYNDANATRNDELVDGLPTFSRIDVSGFGFVVGVKVVDLLKF